MSGSRVDEINVLKLSLHERLVGYLAGFQGGRNVLRFADSDTSVDQPAMAIAFIGWHLSFNNRGARYIVII